jgi:hypothetical protein
MVVRFGCWEKNKGYCPDFAPGRNSSLSTSVLSSSNFKKNLRRVCVLNFSVKTVFSWFKGSVYVGDVPCWYLALVQWIELTFYPSTAALISRLRRSFHRFMI